jgi:hypothetical protein
VTLDASGELLELYKSKGKWEPYWTQLQQHARLLRQADLYKEVEKLYVEAMDNELLPAENRFQAAWNIHRIDKYYRPAASLEETY